MYAAKAGPVTANPRNRMNPSQNGLELLIEKLYFSTDESLNCDDSGGLTAAVLSWNPPVSPGAAGVAARHPRGWSPPAHPDIPRRPVRTAGWFHTGREMQPR